jgi:hypothetical protein
MVSIVLLPSPLRVFLSNDAAKSFFERLHLSLNVFPEGFVDQALIVAAAGSVYLRTKPIKDIVIQANRDPGLAIPGRSNCPSLSFAEIELL